MTPLPGTSLIPMIEGKDIICFSNDWGGDPLSKQHIMLRLARQNRILWVNSLGNRSPRASSRDLKRILGKLAQFARGCQNPVENIYTFSPLAIPFHGNPTARWLNSRFVSWSLRLVCRRLRFRNPITWSFLPRSADIVGNLGEDFIIYHCVDEFSEFTGTDRAAILAIERRLIEKSNVVIVSSGPLYKTKRCHNPNTHLLTHGVDVEHFRKACDPSTRVPDDVSALRHPVIGFYGLIADWIDLALVRYLALSRPAWSFVLIGKVDTDIAPLRGIPNVYLLGRKSYQQLPAFCKGFDVAICPFLVNDLTVAANPLKLREYLAAGLPVVATAIPEAAQLGDALRLGQSPADFLAQIDALLAAGRCGPQLSISRTMDSESWDEKVEELSRIIAALSRPASGGAAHSTRLQPHATRVET
jgi:glycosyltransferase involved in cell wall biosynthesis